MLAFAIRGYRSPGSARSGSVGSIDMVLAGQHIILGAGSGNVDLVEDVVRRRRPGRRDHSNRQGPQINCWRTRLDVLCSPTAVHGRLAHDFSLPRASEELRDLAVRRREMSRPSRSARFPGRRRRGW